MYLTIKAEGTTSEELRASFMRDMVGPIAGYMILGGADQVTFAVAQYWNDQASDEVHFMYSQRWQPHHWHDRDDDDEADDQSRALRTMLRDRGVECGDEYLDVEPEGRAAVRAFASCCIEGATQDHDEADAFTPYAVFDAVTMSEEDAAVALDVLLETGAVPRGMFGDWSVEVRDGVCTGEAPARFLEIVGQHYVVKCPAAATCTIVGKVLRPEWEAVDDSWVNPMEGE